MVEQIREPFPGVATGDSQVYYVQSALSGEAQMPTINVAVANATVATEALQLYTVVAFNANRELVVAELGDVVVGVVAGAVPLGSTGAKTDIYLGGIFDVDVLVYHPSFATEADKLAAFDTSGLTLRAQKNPYAQINV